MTPFGVDDDDFTGTIVGDVRITGNLIVDGILAAPDEVGFYVTGLIDFLAPSVGNPYLRFPTRPGFFFLPFRIFVFSRTRTGVATGGPMSWKTGNSPGHDNMLSGAAGNIAIAAINAVNSPTILAFQNPVSVAGPMLDGSTPPLVDVTAVVGGLTAFAGRIGVHGLWVPS